VPPNFTGYAGLCARLDWSQVPDLCEGMGFGTCNIAYAAVDRHARGPAATRTALRFVTESGWDGVWCFRR
jgi:acetyl-CoA synthetase